MVVIGAGFGGLAATLRLAARGLDVTLIEAQATPGGKARQVDSAAGPIDAGPTVLTLRPVFDDLFAAAGEQLQDHVRLIPQPVLARHWWPDGSTLDLFPDAEASAEAIRAWGGTAAEQDFRAFDRITATAYRAYDGPVMRADRPRIAPILGAIAATPSSWPMIFTGRSLARHLARSFREPRLRQLFARYATYVGGRPEASPAILSLIWQAEARGVWAAEGGLHALARSLASLAVRRGARIRYGTAAARITVSDGAVRGVDLADGTHLPAGHVVFAGDPAALQTGLLGLPVQGAVRRRGVQPRSHSAWVWTFAARAAVPDPGLIHHNVFFASDPAREYAPLAGGRMQDDPTVYICAEDRAEGPPPDGPERFEIILNAPPQPSLGAAPANEFDQCRTTTLSQLARFGLTFDPAPERKHLTTPQMFSRMFPASQGALYGISPHGALATFRRPGARTAIPGLYLAGGGTHPGAGVPMATLSGRHAAEAIWQDLASRSRSHLTAMPGGMSMASATMANVPSRSSDS